jgi:hypothetical protein
MNSGARSESKMLKDQRNMTVATTVLVAALLAAAFSRASSDWRAVGTASVVSFLPIAGILPMHWRGKIAREPAVRESTWLLVGGILGVMVAGANPRVSDLIVLGVASVYFVLVGTIRHRHSRSNCRWVAATGLASGVAGLLADHSGKPGWPTLVFALFGAAAYHAIDLATTGRLAELSDRPEPLKEAM